ncbi:hypothetical protein DACRYDRAFT_17875 [Dacryopinax primogenitus]|uniref:Uncharacterized protein n=1 Tax=Dacryopinax primogenitus (strain DJM 731) TaxID=1858805 RepID=M5FYS2_DACPD|nr:uncharacterized protein DACRYDRAFT_17875 [Dacryopinax primogenitus]EJT98691.1 hypothetical protein DACRYDRAFT_17875 [Dacryopinax primogenitus]
MSSNQTTNLLTKLCFSTTILVIIFRTRKKLTAICGRTGHRWQEHLKGIIKGWHQWAQQALDLEAGSSSRPVLEDSESNSEYEDVEDDREEEEEERVGIRLGVMHMHQVDPRVASNAGATIIGGTVMTPVVSNESSRPDAYHAGTSVTNNLVAGLQATITLATERTIVNETSINGEMAAVCASQTAHLTDETEMNEEEHANAGGGAFLSIGDTLGIWFMQDTSIFLWFFTGAFDQTKKMLKKRVFFHVCRGLVAIVLFSLICWAMYSGGKYFFEHFNIQIGGGQLSISWVGNPGVNSTTTTGNVTPAVNGTMTA